MPVMDLKFIAGSHLRNVCRMFDGREMRFCGGTDGRFETPWHLHENAVIRR
jgi:hypothetical protein